MTYEKRIAEFEIIAMYNGESFDCWILSLKLYITTVYTLTHGIRVLYYLTRI